MSQREARVGVLNKTRQLILPNRKEVAKIGDQVKTTQKKRRERRWAKIIEGVLGHGDDDRLTLTCRRCATDEDWEDFRNGEEIAIRDRDKAATISSLPPVQEKAVGMTEGAAGLNSSPGAALAGAKDYPIYPGWARKRGPYLETEGGYFRIEKVECSAAIRYWQRDGPIPLQGKQETTIDWKIY
jgi:hypothetical protein